MSDQGWYAVALWLSWTEKILSVSLEQNLLWLSRTGKREIKDNMRKLLIACLLSALCEVAVADGAPAEFWQAFTRHQENGTLLHH